jgi:hypothetical protein
LFASKSLFVWENEKRFQELRLEHAELVRGNVYKDEEEKGAAPTVHDESREEESNKSQ